MKANCLLTEVQKVYHQAWLLYIQQWLIFHKKAGDYQKIIFQSRSYMLKYQEVVSTESQKNDFLAENAGGG